MFTQPKHIYSLLVCGILLAFWANTTPTQAITVSPVKTELTASAGSILTITFDAYNDQKESKVYYLDYQTFNAKDESGNPVLSRQKEGISQWFSGPSDITLGPSERQKITVLLSVPTDADAGGHFAAILLRNEPPQIAAEADGVAIGSQIGMLVLLRVSGDFTEGADILEFSTAQNRKFFSTLPVDFFYRFQNNGEDWAKPLGDVVIENAWGKTKKIIPANPTGGNVLPKSIRKYTASWLTKSGDTENPQNQPPPSAPNTFFAKVQHQATYAPIGWYKARLTLTYGSQNQNRAQITTSFWIIPWELLAVVIPSGIVALLILRLALKQYNKYIIAREKRRREIG